MSRSLVKQVHDIIASRNARGTGIAVGLSGGVDSVALLHALLHVRESLGFALSALHVHHGLSPNAEAWTDHCVALCDQWRVPLSVRRVRIDRHDPAGTEAAARTARYACYREADAKFVALAHHQDDQAETVLLQMLRGAGVAGLSAMPVSRPLNAERQLLRPLLGVTRQDILEYATEHTLRWIHDESNLDSSYPRNYLRNEVLPRLEAHFPGYRVALGRVAANAADAAALLDDIARADFAELSIDEQDIDVAKLSALEPVRGANALRFWLTEQGLSAPNREHLLELMRQATVAANDTQMSIELSGATVRRYRDRLTVDHPREQDAHWETVWQGESNIALPDGRTLYFNRVSGRGVSCARLERARVLIAYRRGGERMSVAANRPRKTLKNLLQESGIPPWERARMPLLFIDGQLVWAHGVGADPEYTAAADANGIELEVRGPA